MPTQARLLRVLESGEFIKVGSSKVQKTDVRIVAATNVNLTQAIAEGRFREDLYYRLNTVPIQIPPLRERGDDVLLLFRKFAADFAEKYRMPAIQLTEDAKKILLAYPWPGNIRELRTVVRRATLLAKDGWITATEIGLPGKDRQPEVYSLNDERAERATILKALGATGNDKKAAARLLGISRSTLYLKLKKYRLD